MDNRRALPKYILMLLIAAFFGALAGFAAGIVGAGNLSESIKTAVNTALTAAAPLGHPRHQRGVPGSGLAVLRQGPAHL